MKRLLLLLLFVLVSVFGAAPTDLALAKVALDKHGPKKDRFYTWREQASRCDVVLLVTVLKSEQPTPDTFRSELRIDKRYKDHATIADKKTLMLDRRLVVENVKQPQYVVFGEVTRGELDLFRGEVVTKEMLPYFEGLLKLDAKDRLAQGLFYADHLGMADMYVANDAHAELESFTHQERRELAPKLDAAKLRATLANLRATNNSRAMAALLLGYIGAREDVKRLHTFVDDCRKENVASYRSALTGYILATPKEGWAYALKHLDKPDTDNFYQRYRTLQVASDLREMKPEVLPETALREAMRLLLAQSDIADLAINHLVQWRCWDFTDTIVATYGKKDFDSRLVQNAILKYALQCPDASSNKFIAEQRKTQPERIKDLEEMLAPEAKKK